MADFSTIIQEINEDITTNGVGAITGAKLNEVLRDMIAAVNAAKQDPLTIDATPTEDSTNPVQSGGMYDILNRIFPNSSLFGGYITSYSPGSDDNRKYFLTKESGDLPNFELYNLPNDGKWKFIHWNPRDAAWDWETIDSYTSAQIDQLLSAVAAAISGKQDTISDLATIRSGAAAGATAYQKPSGGIPKTDLASGVQTSLGKADTAFQKPSGGIPASDLAAAVQTSLGKADTALQSYTETDPVFSASPAAGITSGDIADWDGKADPIPVVDASTIPASMGPNKLYKYGTLSGDTVFPPLATPTGLNKANVYWWKFTTPASTINVQLPAAITIWNGGSAPTIDASTTYEITVEDGFGTCIKS